MSMTTLYQMATIPALLVTLAALLALHGDDQESARRRFLLFLPAAGVLLTGVLLAAAVARQGGNFLGYQSIAIVPPAILGVLALVMLNLKSLGSVEGKSRLAAIALLLLFVALLVAATLNPMMGLAYLVVPGAVLAALGWAIGRQHGYAPLLAGVLVLGAVLYANHLMNNPAGGRMAAPRNMVLQFLYAIAIMGAPGLLAALAAGLLGGALGREPDAGEPDRRDALLRIGLAVTLLGTLAYLLFWWTVWDRTVDLGFGAFTMPFIGGAAVGAGMAMTTTLRGKARIGGLLFLALAPTLFYQVQELGQNQSHHELTEARAARIAAALEAYRVREGRYPQSLQALAPRDLLFVPRPIILRGEPWCYRGDAGGYRLAAFHREFFSSPVSLQLYASAGQADGPLPCEERVAEMKERYYSPMEDPQAMQAPQPTPLPTVEVATGKTVVQPLLDGATASPGSWSPDGRYFVFGQQTATITLHFLDAETGEICPTESQFAFVPRLRQRHAWLPDGRLLYLDGDGEMLVFTPCEPWGERLTGQFEETFTELAAYSPEAGRALLKSADAYWLLDGRALTAQRIAGVTPNPYDLHWDNFAWLPGSEDRPRLAISRLNGRDSSEGSTLYLLDGENGAVQTSLPLPYASDQSAPFIEGLPGDKILMHGSGDWLIVDFSVDPPATTNVLADIFGLDVTYPDDVSAAGAFLQKDGQYFYLATRLNHPRNRALYLYDSAGEQVHIYDHEVHSLLLFPNGELVTMISWDDGHLYRDEYDLVQAAQPEAAQVHLVLEGHAPRDYAHLFMSYLPETSQIAVASAHGVSLVSLPDGEMVEFWELPGPGFSPWLISAPDGSAFMATKDQGGLYGPLP